MRFLVVETLEDVYGNRFEARNTYRVLSVLQVGLGVCHLIATLLKPTTSNQCHGGPC